MTDNKINRPNKIVLTDYETRELLKRLYMVIEELHTELNHTGHYLNCIYPPCVEATMSIEKAIKDIK